MSYIALYRAWRPAQWGGVVGQKAVVRILMNALSTGKVSHAYLFSGPRGTGKTTVARLLAKAVNCESPKGSEPCNECRSCSSIMDGSSVDVIEIDAASNRGIDEIRSLRESVRYVPVLGRFKVYIIDEVHMLTQEAFNALLKTLEEPPEHVIFVMATTAPHKIPLTITSRCQRLDFRRHSVADIEGQMDKILTALSKENPLAWEKDALRVIARSARGSMRDALSILDLCLTYGEGRVSQADVLEILGETSADAMMRLFRAIAQRDLKAILESTREASDRGKDMGEMCEEIAEFARDLLLVRSGSKASDIGRPKDEVDEMAVLSKAISAPLLIGVLDAAAKAAIGVRNQDDPRLVVEMSLLGLFLRGDTEGAKMTASRDAAAAPALGPITGKSPEKPVPAGNPVSGSTSQPSRTAGGPVLATAPKTSADVKQPDAGTPSPSSQADMNPLEQVKACWPKLLDSLSQAKKVMAKAYLMPASPVRLDPGNKLVLAYPPRFKTHMEQIMAPDNRNVVEQYLHRLTRQTFSLSVEPAEIDPDLQSGGNGGNGNGGDTGGNGDGGGNGGSGNYGTGSGRNSLGSEGSGSSGKGLHPLVKAAITIVDGKVVPQGGN